jgi:hypothetical protein
LNEVALNTLSTTDLGFEMPVGGLAMLTFDQASRLIERMKKNPPPKKSNRDDDDIDIWYGPVDPVTGEAAK